MRLLKVTPAGQREAEPLIGESQVTRRLVDALLAEADKTYSVERKLMIFNYARVAARKTGDREAEGIVLRRVGKILLNSDQEEQAREAWKEARSLMQGGRDLKEMVMLFSESADLERYFSDYQQARRFASQSLTMAEGLPLADKSGEVMVALARSHDTLGLCDRWEGRYEDSLRNLRRALGEYEALQGGVPGVGRKIVQVVINIGRVYRTLGDYQEALDNYNRALALNVGKDPNREGEILNSIGVLYDEQRNYQKAQSYYKRSLEIFKSVSARSKFSSVKLNIGINCLMQNRPDEALKWYRESLADAEADKYKDDVLAARKAVAGVLLKKGDYETALKYLAESEPLAEELNDKVQLAEIHWRRAEALYNLKDHRGAVEAARQALELSEQMSLPNLTWLSLTVMGKSYLAQDDRVRAAEAFSLAVAGVEKSRARVAGTDLDHQFFFEDKLEPYHGLVRVMVAQGKAAEALSLAEKARARVLFDLKQQARVDQAQIITAAERERERKLRAELASLNAQYLKEQAKSAPGEGPVNALTEKLRDARIAWESFQADLAASHPQLKFRRDKVPELSASEITSVIPDGQTAFLSYVVTADQAFLFVLTRAGRDPSSANVGAYTLAASAESVNRTALLFNQKVAGRTYEFKAPGRRLYDLLIAPAENQLRGITKLCIVPDGQLWKVPFQALVLSEGKFLLERFTVSYSPSLSHLAQTGRSPRAEEAAEESRRPGLLAVGNPISPGTGLKALPESEKEAATLGRVYGAGQSKMFIGAEAVEDKVRAVMANYRVLHFATHGLLDDLEPMYSALVLAGSGQGSDDDGLLEAWEVARLKLRAELAVLSACDTAGGKVRSGEGLIGMAWAFLAAGVRTTVVSQWAVDSEATRELMTAFHRYVARASRETGRIEGCATALREAALKMRHKPGTEHPFFWAGFAVVGQGH